MVTPETAGGVDSAFGFPGTLSAVTGMATAGQHAAQALQLSCDAGVAASCADEGASLLANVRWGWAAAAEVSWCWWWGPWA